MADMGITPTGVSLSSTFSEIEKKSAKYVQYCAHSHNVGKMLQDKREKMTPQRCHQVVIRMAARRVCTYHRAS